MRISEYIDTSSDHFLLCDDVFFIIGPITGEISVNCTLIYMYPLSSINAVIITVRSGKNDIYGISHTLCFDKIIPVTGAYDLCTTMYNWCTYAMPQLSLPFLWYHGLRIIDSSDINSTIKSVASSNGFNPSHFSSHSLRIDGASTRSCGNTYLDNSENGWLEIYVLSTIYQIIIWCM